MALAVQEVFDGKIEQEEIYFEKHVTREKEVVVVAGKVAVFGILKKEGKVYTVIVKECEFRFNYATLRQKFKIL